jgi:ketosteroid isomerase-like protein
MKTIETGTVAFVRESMDAYRRGDLQTVRRTWAYNIVWHAPGEHPLAGDHRGADAIFAYLANLFELSEGTFDPELVGLDSPDGSEVLATFRNTASRWAKRLHDDSTLTIRVAHGSIAEITERHTDQGAWDAFWSDDPPARKA